MAVMTPVMIQTIRATPTELAFSNTPFGLTKIPEPMMLPGGATRHDHYYHQCFWLCTDWKARRRINKKCSSTKWERVSLNSDRSCWLSTELWDQAEGDVSESEEGLQVDAPTYSLSIGASGRLHRTWKEAPVQHERRRLSVNQSLAQRSKVRSQISFIRFSWLAWTTQTVKQRRGQRLEVVNNRRLVGYKSQRCEWYYHNLPGELNKVMSSSKEPQFTAASSSLKIIQNLSSVSVQVFSIQYVSRARAEDVHSLR